MNFGSRLKALRKEKGLTQAQLARLSGLSNGCIANYERGKRTRISVEVLNRLASALDVKPEELGFNRRPDLEAKMQESMQHHIDADLEALISAYDMLNAKGRAVAIERVRELAEIDRYRG